MVGGRGERDGWERWVGKKGGRWEGVVEGKGGREEWKDGVEGRGGKEGWEGGVEERGGKEGGVGGGELWEGVVG